MTSSTHPVIRSAAAAALVLVCGAAGGQPASTTPETSNTLERAPASSSQDDLRSKFLDREDGQLDLGDFLAKPRRFLPVPIIVTEPAVGYGGGGVALFLRPREEAGKEGWSRPNMSVVGGLATRNGTWAAFAGDSSRWMEGRLRTLAGGGAGQVNLDFYGVTDERSSLDVKTRYSLRFTGALMQANWKIAADSAWSVGVRYVYASVDPRLRDDPTTLAVARPGRVEISAPTAVLEYDSRDNVFTPTRGIYAETSLLAAREAFGASVDFTRFEQLVLAWHPLPRDVTLGVRGNFAGSSSGTPFFLRHYIDLRGVPVMRYQGDRVGAVELEGRWQFHGRWSAVGFAGTGLAKTQRNVFSATQTVGSGGVGFRYELARSFGLHAGIDVAHSPGTTAVYLQIGNAWFRP